MTDEPGFTIRVVVAGSAVDLRTSADTARQNVIKSSKARRTSLPRVLTDEDLTDRALLHSSLQIVATDVLLVDDVSIRSMQDIDGNWWSFQRSSIGAVCVIDDAGSAAKPIGFAFPDN